MKHPEKLVIASRESALAMWQAEHIRARLLQLYPACQIDILGITTQGDRILDKTLSKIGGKGLFVKELETALADGRADLAVHSAKDMPMQMPQGFLLAAITERAEPTDAFVSPHYASLNDLPEGAVVGTSSLRRQAQICHLLPHLRVQPLRGNLQTRLAKLDSGQYDAIILAASGLMRLGLTERIRAILPAEQSLPAAGQGALGIEIASHRYDLIEALNPLNDARTHACVSAERVVAAELGGSCQIPIAAYCTEANGILHLRALVGQPDGRVILRAQAQAPMAYAEAIGRDVAEQLKQQGALALIEQVLAESTD